MHRNNEVFVRALEYCAEHVLDTLQVHCVRSATLVHAERVRRHLHTCSPLARAHPVWQFDARIRLEELNHVYVIDGERNDANDEALIRAALAPPPYVSTTALVHQCFENFDAQHVSARMVRAKNWPQSEYRARAEDYAACIMAAEQAERTVILSDDDGDDDNERWLELCAESVRNDFLSANQLGTLMHDRIEHLFEGVLSCERFAALPGEEYAQVLRFVDEWVTPRKLRPFRMELRVFDTKLRICGSIDGLFELPGDYDTRDGERRRLVMIDWKRSRTLRTSAFRGRKGTWPLHELDDCNFSHYVMQQNMYRYMVHTHAPHLHIEQMYLAVFHPLHQSYEVYEVPDRTPLVHALIKQRRAKVVAVAVAKRKNTFSP